MSAEGGKRTLGFVDVSGGRRLNRMRRWLTGAVALFAGAVSFTHLSGPAMIVRNAGSWVVYPPGILEGIRQDTAICILGLLVTIIFAVLTLRRRRSEP